MSLGYRSGVVDSVGNYMNPETQCAGVIDVACYRTTQNAGSQIPAPAGDVAERTGAAAAGPRVDCYCRYLTWVSRRLPHNTGKCARDPRDVYERVQ